MNYGMYYTYNETPLKRQYSIAIKINKVTKMYYTNA